MKSFIPIAFGAGYLSNIFYNTIKNEFDRRRSVPNKKETIYDQIVLEGSKYQV